MSHIKNIDVTHETSDVSVSALLRFVLALTIMTVVVYVLMWGLFKFFNSRAEKEEAAPGPMALSKEERLPPPPRLQAAKGFEVKMESGEIVKLELKAPEAEYQVVRAQWERQLNCEQPVEPGTIVGTPSASGEAQHMSENTKHTAAERKVVDGCTPIDVAMKKLLEQGLPSRTEKSGEDITMPTAASSGRLPERVAK